MNKKFDGRMFDDPNEVKIRFGDYAEKVNFHKYDHLKEVETFFLNEMNKYPTYPCYDVNGAENPYFDTLGYSNFSDFFMMYPLQPDLKHTQITESLIYDNETSEKHYNIFEIYRDKILNSDVNKYATLDVKSKKIEATVVLIGSNRFDELCFNKLNYIYKTHGQLAVFKPHPLTDEKSLNKLNDNLPVNTVISNKDENLYDFIKSSDIVYSSHSSESVFHSLCIGKKVDTISTFQSRWFSSFGHINSHLFETDTPEFTINKIFNNYRSGLVNPKIHEDWKERISKYLEYIHEKRKKYRYAYVNIYTC